MPDVVRRLVERRAAQLVMAVNLVAALCCTEIRRGLGNLIAEQRRSGAAVPVQCGLGWYVIPSGDAMILDGEHVGLQDQAREERLPCSGSVGLTALYLVRPSP